MDLSADRTGKYVELRRRAKQIVNQNRESIDSLSLEEIQKIVFELDTYHLELEQQNTFLRQALKKVETPGKREDDIENSRKLWEQSLDIISDLAIIIDTEMNIVQANKAACSSADVSPGSLSGKKCYEVFGGFNRPCLKCPVPATLSDGTSHSTIINSEVGGRTLHITSSPITCGEKISYIINISRDITEQRKLEEAASKAHKMQAIGTLANGIAHEFNNILAIILGLAAFAKFKIPPGNPARNDIDGITDAANRAVELVKQVLIFGGKKEFHPQKINPHIMIEEALRVVRPTLPSTVQLLVEIDRSSGKVFADPSSIHYIFHDLYTNALTAMKDDGGTLAVKVYPVESGSLHTVDNNRSHTGKYVVLSVGDTGCGMEEATLKRIFEPFFTTKGLGDGPGLGLAVIHGIVEELKGFIDVKSRPGQGSVFSVYIPQFEEESVLSNPAAHQRPVTSSSGERKRILVVDDEPIILELYQFQLEACGYEPITLQDSEEALQVFCKHPDRFDLIITDHCMPNLNGDQLAKRVLEVRPDLPIVMITGHNDIFTEQHARSVGIAKFMTKPIDNQRFVEILRDLLGEEMG